MSVRHEAPLRLGALTHGHRSRVAEILRATGAFHEAEVTLALELFDATFGAPCAIATAPRDADVADYEFVGSFSSEDALVGYACFGATPSTDGTYDLYWIAVAPEHHRQGAGSQLLDAVERQLACRDGRLLVVETSSRADYDGTRRFYERHRYARVAQISDFYAPGDHRVILIKRLPRSPGSAPPFRSRSSVVPRPNPEFTRHE